MSKNVYDISIQIRCATPAECMMLLRAIRNRIDEDNMNSERYAIVRRYGSCSCEVRTVEE